MNQNMKYDVEVECVSENTNGSTPVLLNSAKSNCAIPNNVLLTYQKIYDSIKVLKKNAKRQLEQAEEIKDQLKQLKPLLTQQQQSTPVIPRHINQTNQTRIHRYQYHPYLHNSASTAQTEYHSQQADVTTSFHEFINDDEITYGH
jgi:hypothetical protein